MQALILLLLGIIYLWVASRLGIVDTPVAARSSHEEVTITGGGVIFLFAVWLYSARSGWCYPWFVLGLTLIGGVSFIDDVHPLSSQIRLAVQMVVAELLLYQLNVASWENWWIDVVALVVCLGVLNVYNFMDGINGMTGGYSLAVLIPLICVNGRLGFIETNLLNTVALSVLVFCLFNFRPRGKARCFAGDVGSIGIAFILLFAIGRLVLATGDVTWLILLLVYGVDGCLTICHRIMLRENLGEAHRKHAYQLMANELGMSHVAVSLIYAGLQLAVSLGFVYLCPPTVLAHWVYLIGALAVLALGYVGFMRRYYYLHEAYLASLK